MNYRIDRCRSVRDLEGLTELCAAHAEYERLSFDPCAFETRIGRWLEVPEPTAFIWMARLGSRPVGYAAASTEFSTLAAAPYLHLDCLFLLEEARSSGLGSHLVAEVVAHAQSLGLTWLEWQTPDWNEGAARFYARLGATSRSKTRFMLPTRTFSWPSSGGCS